MMLFQPISGNFIEGGSATIDRYDGQGPHKVFYTFDEEAGYLLCFNQLPLEMSLCEYRDGRVREFEHGELLGVDIPVVLGMIASMVRERGGCNNLEVQYTSGQVTTYRSIDEFITLLECMGVHTAAAYQMLVRRLGWGAITRGLRKSVQDGYTQQMCFTLCIKLLGDR